MADETENKTAAENALAEAYENSELALQKLNAQRQKAKEHLKTNTELTEELKEKLREAERDYRNAAKAADGMAESLNLATAQGEAFADGLLRSVGMSKDFERSFIGSALAITESEDAMKSFTEKIKKNITWQRIGINLLQKFADATFILTKETDSALVAFNKQTGASRLYAAEIKSLEAQMYHHGVGVKEATEAYGAMVENVTDLRLMSASARDDLSKTTGLLAHMGVSADTTASNVQFMTKSIGLSAEAATSYQRQLFALAKEIGMPPDQMAAGFKAAAPKLAAFGKQAGKVFKDLAVNARAAGMEVEQLLKITEQFDTFEGAAESVGKLNALLGGPFLNSMEMVMTTDPTERMRLLSGALNDAGKSFDQMTYYEKKSIAAAAGLSDVNELALVMAGSFNESAGGANKSQAEIEALAKQSQEFNTIMEELNQVMRMFAIQLEPVVSWAKWLIQGFQNLNQYTGGYLIPTILGLAFVIKTLQVVQKAWNLITGITVKTQDDATKSTIQRTQAEKASIPVTKGVGKASGGAAAGMFKFSLAALAVGAAFFLIGAGIGVAATGMSMFMDSLLKFSPATIALYGPAFVSFAVGMSALTLALSFMYPLWPFILGLGAGFMLLSYAIGQIDFSNLQPVADLFRGMADAMNAPIENLLKIASAINQISDAIGAVDDINAAVAMTQLIETSSTAGASQPGGIIGQAMGAKKPPKDHKITLQFDPRKAAFKDFVVEIVKDELKTSQGKPA